MKTFKIRTKNKLAWLLKLLIAYYLVFIFFFILSLKQSFSTGGGP